MSNLVPLYMTIQGLLITAAMPYWISSCDTALSSEESWCVCVFTVKIENKVGISKMDG